MRRKHLAAGFEYHREMSAELMRKTDLVLIIAPYITPSSSVSRRSDQWKFLLLHVLLQLRSQPVHLFFHVKTIPRPLENYF